MIISDANEQLKKASGRNNTEGVISAIENGADVNIKFGSNSNSPIMYALFNFNFRLIQYLITAGADVTIKNIHDRNFLYYLQQKQTLPEFVIGDILRWFKNYDTQKIIMEKNPHSIFELKKYKFLDQNIKDEFSYLLTADDLNLI